MEAVLSSPVFRSPSFLSFLVCLSLSLDPAQTSPRPDRRPSYPWFPPPPPSRALRYAPYLPERMRGDNASLSAHAYLRHAQHSASQGLLQHTHPLLIPPDFLFSRGPVPHSERTKRVRARENPATPYRTTVSFAKVFKFNQHQAVDLMDIGNGDRHCMVYIHTYGAYEPVDKRFFLIFSSVSLFFPVRLHNLCFLSCYRSGSLSTERSKSRRTSKGI